MFSTNKKRTFSLLPLITLAFVLALTACNKSRYNYETAEGDPLDAKIYTLDNGLKIYMTVNHEQPRIQTYIAVHAGGKDDPSESTGLAHYLEHLMFKGTKSFGTIDYEREIVELDKIDSLYEVYNHTTDDAERKAIYHLIDSVSYEASRYSIANEYDKLMAAIGSQGTNAYTDYDVTCYVEDIPSNQVENWARIQADRFQNMVIRLFHTELEAVYEEKNISMADDDEKMYDTLLATLYPNHPYGQQTILGSQDHLKNPSIKNIRKYFETYYRPNNVAICLAGDFDPDEMVDVINRYFGEWKPNDNITRKEKKPETEITQPIVREVFGEEAEQVCVGWRTVARNHEDQVALDALDRILSNGKVGLFDTDLRLKGKVIEPACYNGAKEDAFVFLTTASPLSGQTLDEAKDLLLAEVAKLRSGDFDEQLLQSVITNKELADEKAQESNDSRADNFVQAFVNGIAWKDYVDEAQRFRSLKKEDIVRVANKYLGDNNYAVIYKRQGKDTSVAKIQKPEIHPVLLNADSVSDFVREIQQSKVKQLTPVFVDFDKDITKAHTANGLEVLTVKNDLNSLFSLSYVYDFGALTNRCWNTALEYFDYLGTDKYTVEELQQRLYSIGCSASVECDDYQTNIRLTGLDSNRTKAMRILEDWLSNMKADEDAWTKLKESAIKRRFDSKNNINFVAACLRQYACKGEDMVHRSTLSNAELKELKAKDLCDLLRNTFGTYTHEIQYCGPADTKTLVAELDSIHAVGKTLVQAPVTKRCYNLVSKTNEVWYCSYNSDMSVFNRFATDGTPFDVKLCAVSDLFNEYFDGGMNSIVFQEVRERRALAYSAGGDYAQGDYYDEPYTIEAAARTQVDKLAECSKVFDDIINRTPRLPKAFDLAKQSWLSRQRSGHLVREGILNTYAWARRHGLDYCIDKDKYETVQKLTLDDIMSFHAKYIQNRPTTYIVVADRSRVDMNALRALGNVHEVRVEDICGY